MPLLVLGCNEEALSRFAFAFFFSIFSTILFPINRLTTVNSINEKYTMNAGRFHRSIRSWSE